MSDLPSGTVTFLFTDVEGSTRLWERDRAAMAAAVERHSALLDSAIQTHGGVRFKTVGDAVQAAFPTAPDAVAAALDAQRALVAASWPDRIDSLPVRMALHTTAAEPRDGDYLAPGLNRLARLVAAVHGGQVLLSSATQDLARDALPVGADLRDLGEHPLRDLYRPERVFQLLHADLPDHFPPLRTLAARPNNLPLQPTRFIGREELVARVVDLLRRGDVRLLTITGPGGVGKTRLALQAGAELLEGFPDGAWFVDLSLLDDPASVPAAIAAVLGIREEGSTPIDRLASVLSGKHLLLILDNFERVIDATPSVSDLLSQIPGLKVLATSRARLRAYGEQEFPLSPFSLPDPAQLPPPEDLSQYEAVRLFVDRAQAVNPDFALTNANAPSVVEICSRLDGLPLAIELAATYSKMLPPQALLKRLERRVPLLTGGARTLPARQQTMRDAIAWGHDLLTMDEQIMFRRLAVFSGGCTLAAAEDVAAEPGPFDAFSTLAALVDKSLMRHEEGVEGEPHFRMLETVREFGLDRLEAAAEADAIRHRHLAYYVALSVAAERDVWLGTMSLLDRLELEVGNLRAAMAWAERASDARSGLLLAATFGMFTFHRGPMTEGREWLARLLALDGAAPATVRATAAVVLGWLGLFQGDLDTAERVAQQAIDLAETEAAILANALNLRACVLQDRGLLPAARQRFEEALAIARRQPPADVLALASLPGVLTNFGVLDLFEGRRQDARAKFEAGLAVLPATEIGLHRTLLLGNLADLSWEEGDHRRSAALSREALVLAGKARTPFVIVNRLDHAARHIQAAGQPALVVRLLGAAEELRQRAGIPVETPNIEWREELLRQTQATLGEPAFSAAWAEGKEWSVDQAIAQAQEALAEIVT